MTAGVPDTTWSSNYATTGALETRLETLRRFYRPSGRFGFDVLAKSAAHARHVLEIGPGTGVHAAAYLERTGAWPASWTLLDRSEAMVHAATRALPRNLHPRGIVAGADRMPLAADERFDLVVAMHVLPFVTSPLRVLRAAARRLSPGGRLLITTPATDDMLELRQPVRAVLREHGLPWRHVGPGYAAVRAERDLRKLFDRVTVHRQEGAVEFTDAVWPVRYVLSMGWFADVPESVPSEVAKRLRQAARQAIDATGKFSVAKGGATFVATRPR